MKNKNTGYFPEPPPEGFYPQFSAVEHKGVLYRLQLDTFHLYENAPPIHNPPEHSHDVFHIVLYRAGINSFKLDGRKVESRPDMLALVPPGVPHCFRPLRPGGSVYHEITFSLIAAGKQLQISFSDLFKKYYGNALNSSQMMFDLDKPSGMELEILYFELGKVLSKYDSSAPFPVYRSLGKVFEFLFEKVFSRNMEDESEDVRRLGKARKYIEQRFREKLLLKDLAVISGMSPEHFCREFKKAYGEPPFEMRNRLRINAAIKLLLYSNRPIKQIAEELGYSDIYHFSKAFKKQSGFSPGKFRKGK